MNPKLHDWNTQDQTAAATAVLPCNGSHAWANTLAASRPVHSAAELLLASDTAWQKLPEIAWQQAFASHPRIGEQHAPAAATSLVWSRQEQSSASSADPEPLSYANQVYEQKFGRTFIICATGLTQYEILAAMQARMANTPAQELAEAAEQQRLITRLRLTRWLEGN